MFADSVVAADEALNDERRTPCGGFGGPVFPPDPPADSRKHHSTVIRSWFLRARLDDKPGAELPLGQLEPGVAELLGQGGGDHEPRKGAVDVLLFLEDLERVGPGGRDLVELPLQLLEREDPPLELGRLEENVRVLSASLRELSRPVLLPSVPSRSAQEED